MCMICIEFVKGKMTTTEAMKALGEMSRELGDHTLQVQKLITEQMDKEFEALGYAVETNEHGTIDRDVFIDDTAAD